MSNADRPRRGSFGRPDGPVCRAGIIMFNDAQPRVPAGRHDGGQFTQADEGGRTQDLAPTLGDSAMVDAIVAAGAEAYVAGISAERVSTYLRTVGRNDLLAPDDAAMHLTPWEGFNAQGHPLRRKSTCLSKEQENRLVKATDEEPVRTYLTRKERLGQPVAGPLPWEYVRLTEEGRRVALENLLLEAHDTQALAARQLGFSVTQPRNTRIGLSTIAWPKQRETLGSLIGKPLITLPRRF